MTEEKKEELKEVKPQEAAAKAPEAPAQPSAAEKPAEAVVNAADTPPPTAAKPAEAAKEAKPEVKKEKPSNCGGCNKSIKKKRWYYRDGKYYCSKRCFKATLKKEEKTEEPKA